MPKPSPRDSMFISNHGHEAPTQPVTQTENLRTSEIEIMERILFSSIASIAFIIALSVCSVQADEPEKKCARCGAPNPTCKVCKPVTETKKVSKTEYECECEDFCVPGRSTLCGEEESCDDCGNAKCTKIWQQNCAKIRSRKVLKKSTKEEDVVSYRWVVEEICDACAQACPDAEIITPSPAEPIPAPHLAPQPATPPTARKSFVPQIFDQHSGHGQYGTSADATNAISPTSSSRLR